MRDEWGRGEGRCERGEMSGEVGVGRDLRGTRVHGGTGGGVMHCPARCALPPRVPHLDACQHVGEGGGQRLGCLVGGLAGSLQAATWGRGREWEGVLIMMRSVARLRGGDCDCPMHGQTPTAVLRA